jgi:magnesium-transporting ATPase (P-type)
MKGLLMIATTWGTGQVAYSILWFFLIFIEIWLAISVFIDIFRSHDMKGWVKAAWIILVMVLPIIGILAYLILRGDKMRVHQMQAAQDQEQFARAYIQQFSGNRQSTADEISKLAELKNKGEITDAEFDELKSHVIAHAQKEHLAPQS